MALAGGLRDMDDFAAIRQQADLGELDRGRHVLSLNSPVKLDIAFLADQVCSPVTLTPYIRDGGWKMPISAKRLITWLRHMSACGLTKEIRETISL
jgi:hypothetical protein